MKALYVQYKPYAINKPATTYDSVDWFVRCTRYDTTRYAVYGRPKADCYSQLNLPHISKKAEKNKEKNQK